MTVRPYSVPNQASLRRLGSTGGQAMLRRVEDGAGGPDQGRVVVTENSGSY